MEIFDKHGCCLSRYTGIGDDELDSIVEDIQRQNPNCDQQMPRGFLRDRGIKLKCSTTDYGKV